MKHLSVITLLLLLVCLPLSVMAQTTHLKFTQDGLFGSFSASTGPNSSVSLSVSQNSSGGNTSTASINFNTFTVAADFSTETFTTVFGSIPSSDLSGSVQNLSLNFSTADLDPNNSFAQTCVLDLNLLTLNCTPATGTITATFTANKAQSTSVLLSIDTVVGTITTRSHQRSDNSTANASGAVSASLSPTGAEFDFSVGNATVGLNHSSTMEFIKN